MKKKNGLEVTTCVELASLTWYECAARERIAAEAGSTHAYRAVIHDPTCGALTARVRAGIDALVVLAGTIGRAVRADGALGSTAGRCADVSRQAGANGLAVALPALTVRSAGGS